jgi:hypothetical protein
VNIMAIDQRPNHSGHRYGYCYFNVLQTGDIKPTTLTCALFTLKINIKSPNYFYELKFLGKHLTKAPRSA